MCSNALSSEKTKVKNGYLYLDSPFLKYYQYPEFLLKVPVSQTAKILYTILYNRARLSMKNNWTDEEGKVYLVYPIADLVEKTGKSISAVKAGLNELIDVDLLEKTRIGFGKPNRMYVKIPSENTIYDGLFSDHHTGGKQPSKQYSKTNNMSQKACNQQSGRCYSRKRTGAFEDYHYDGEDSL